MRINNNIAALNTYNRLAANQITGNKSLEKLSSGLRINRAGDDAAGLAISEKMRAQIRGLNQAGRNAQDGISLIQTAEGALSETHSILQRMRELAVQGASDTLEDNDRGSLQTEIDQLISEIDRIATSTQFNGKNLLNGTFGVTNSGTGTMVVGTDGVTAISVAGAAQSMTYTLTNIAAGKVQLADANGNIQVISGLADSYTGTLNFDKLGIKITGAAMDLDGTSTLSTKTIITSAAAQQSIQIGANENEELDISIGSMTAATLAVNGLSVGSNSAAGTAITAVNSALTSVSTLRANLGAWQNRLEHTINNLSTASENLTASESRIRDVDMASEMMNFTKSNILTQAATAMLAQANQQPQAVLQLLR